MCPLFVSLTALHGSPGRCSVGSGTKRVSYGGLPWSGGSYGRPSRCGVLCRGLPCSGGGGGSGSECCPGSVGMSDWSTSLSFPAFAHIRLRSNVSISAPGDDRNECLVRRLVP